MSVKEAVGLVLNSLIISKGGEVFILDMGKPVKILDLAKKMMRLLGYSEKINDSNKKGIEIQFTGLRPGEKLYEELLIGKDPIMTSHKDIFMEKESLIDSAKIELIINEIEDNIRTNNTNKLINVLERNVSRFKYNS